MKMIPTLLAALALVGCATVAPYQGDPPKMTPQTIMAGRPCSGVNWSKYANINMGPTGSGWSKTPPPGGELSCGYKYLPSLYCADKTKCVDSTWGAPTPPNMDGATIHWAVDVLQGSISICAQQSDRFGLSGKLDCDRVVCAAVGSTPTRCVLPVQVKGQAQPQSPTQVIFSALRDGTVIGAVGTAEVTDVQ